MVIKKLNSVFSAHSRLIFGIFALLIIVAFTPGIIGGCNQDMSNDTVGTAFGERVTYKDLIDFHKQVYPARILGCANVNSDDYQELFRAYCTIKRAESLGLYATDAEIAGYIKSHPAFRKNGAFDTASFDRFLNENNLSDADITAALRAVILNAKLTLLFNPVSDEEAKNYYAQSGKAFELEFCLLDQEKISVVPPKADDLKKYFDDNKFRYVDDKGNQKQFAAALNDVRQDWLREKQLDAAAKNAQQKVAALNKLPAAAQAAAFAKAGGKYSKIAYPFTENISQNDPRLINLQMAFGLLNDMKTGDIKSTGSLMVRAAKVTPADMEIFALKKIFIKNEIVSSLIQREAFMMQFGQVSKNISARLRLDDEINRYCSYTGPKSESAE